MSEQECGSYSLPLFLHEKESTGDSMQICRNLEFWLFRFTILPAFIMEIHHYYFLRAWKAWVVNAPKIPILQILQWVKSIPNLLGNNEST
jgi:hypothetical protein